MKRILIWIFILSFSLAAARAQDDATQQQINELNGHIRDQQETLDAQKKRIDALEKEISELRDKSNGSGANPGANPDDLQKLADQVQELAKKQQADNDLILKEIGKLGKVSGSSSSPVHKSTPSVTTNAAAGGKESGYEHKVAAGDTLLSIAKAYRDQQGIKVTSDQILKANPGLNPNTLKVGQKIFIPAPAQ
jgi:LysM repeat protein